MDDSLPLRSKLSLHVCFLYFSFYFPVQSNFIYRTHLNHRCWPERFPCTVYNKKNTIKHSNDTVKHSEIHWKHNKNAAVRRPSEARSKHKRARQQNSTGGCFKTPGKRKKNKSKIYITSLKADFQLTVHLLKIHKSAERFQSTNIWASVRNRKEKLFIPTLWQVN